MLALLSLLLGAVVGQAAFDSANSQYIVEMVNAPSISWNTSTATEFNLPFYSLYQIGLPFSFSFFFAPFREVYIDRLGLVHFDYVPPCCERTTCNFSLSNHSGTGEPCDLNTTYYNILSMFAGSEDLLLNSSYETTANSVTIFFSDDSDVINYRVVLKADSTIELTFQHPPSSSSYFSSSDALFGLRRASGSGPSDSLEGAVTAIAGVYIPPNSIISNDTQFVFCPLTTVFCAAPRNVSRIGGDKIHITAGLTNTECFSNYDVNLTCLFVNADNASEVVSSGVATVLPDGFECVSPALPSWNAVDLRLAQTSTGKQIYHDSRSLLRLAPSSSILPSSSSSLTPAVQCTECLSFLPRSRCPFDCASELFGNASLDDCRVCVSGLGGVPNLNMSCRGMCFETEVVQTDRCLCNQSLVPDQNQRVVTPGRCWDGQPFSQPELQDILHTTDTVNIYRLVAVIACGLALLYWPLSLLHRKCKQPANALAQREREAIAMA